MISEKLKSILLKELNLKDFEFNDETTASDVPGWDSLQHLNIIVAVEKSYSIKFKGLEVMRVQNIGDLQKLIHTMGTSRM